MKDNKYNNKIFCYPIQNSFAFAFAQANQLYRIGEEEKAFFVALFYFLLIL